MFRSFKYRAATAISVVCLSILATASPALADIRISAAPSLLEVTAAPGGSGTQDITVTNAGNEAFSVVADSARYKSAEGSISAVSWLKAEPARFDLAAGERRTVKVTISVPPDATSGGHYAMIALRTGGVSGSGTGVGVAAQIGVPFLITVNGSGTVVKQASVDSVVAVLEQDGELGFRVAVANRGNVHFYARGTVEIADAAGKTWGRVALRESTALLPGTKESLQSDQSIPFNQGETYTATGSVTIGDGNPAVKTDARFTADAAMDVEDVIPLTTPSGGLQARVTLRNKGGLGLMPKIMAAIRGEGGKVVGVFSPDQPQLVLPGQAVQIDAAYPGTLTSGNYALVVRAEFGSQSAQREAQFRIVSSGPPADGSVPINKWAGATSNGAQGAPASPASQAAVEGPGTQGIPVPVAVIGIVVLAIIGLAAAWYKSRVVHGAPRLRIRLALPSPNLGFGVTSQMMQYASRGFGSARGANMLPPPPIHLLPPPADWKLRPPEGRPIVQAGTSAWEMPAATGSTGAPVEAAHATPPPSAPTGPTNKVEADKRPGSRLARAVASRAAALVNQAAEAAAAGDRAAVDRLCRQAIKLDPWNVDAWLWLAASCEDPKSTRLCLEAVLLLDPANVKAKRGVAALGQQRTRDTRTGEDSGDRENDGRGSGVNSIPRSGF